MRKFIALVLISSMLFMASCSSTSPETEVSLEATTTASLETTFVDVSETSSEEVEETLDYEVTYPLTIVDQAGREVVIEEEPGSLVSAYYITSSLFIALDIEEKMVGIESNPEKRPIYELSAPELLDLPQVGSPKDFDFEACVALEPDLVVLPMRLRDVADQLEELDIDVIIVNPESEELFSEMTTIVATATNSLEKADELLSYIDDVQTMLIEAGADINPTTVYLGGNSSFLSTASSGMYQSFMIELAGATNVGDEIDDTYWVEVSYEQILAWNPEYIILAANSEYSVEDVLNDESLMLCDAVINGNVYKLPSEVEAWDSPVPSSVLGSLWLASVLYPDTISEETCNEVIEEFYETFYGISYSSVVEAEPA